MDNVAAEWIKNAALFIAGLAATIYYIKEIFFPKPPEPISPQPLIVEIKKELHEMFADREQFEAHVKANTKMHAQLFERIEGVDRQQRDDVDQRFEDLQIERARTLEKINEHFSGLKVDIGSIKTELRIRNEVAAPRPNNKTL